MERSEYRLVDVAHTLLISFPGGASTDTVVISIYDVDDAALDVDKAAMTSVNASNWKYSWTPSQTNNYIITFRNSTLDVEYYLYVKVTGSIAGVAGGSGSGTTLTNLRTRFLKLLDNYNANDLTGTNSSGEVADLCLNDALQLIYAQIKDSKYMKANPSTLTGTANQEYIELSGISDLDEVFCIRDTTNNITLKAIPFWLYRLQVPDPSELTGTPYRYARLFNRIYLTPRMTSGLTYQVDYVKNFARLSSDSDQALIPSKYDDWIYKEARVIWFQMEEPDNVAKNELAIKLRDDAREIYINDVMSEFDLISEAKSHWDDESSFPPYDSPIGS